MLEKPTEVVLQIVGEYFRLVYENFPKWEFAYFRFRIDEEMKGMNASCVMGGLVLLVDVSENRMFFGQMMVDCENLFKSLNKRSGVMLLAINAAREYKVLYEFEDLDRWIITKLDGGSGVPQGFSEPRFLPLKPFD